MHTYNKLTYVHIYTYDFNVDVIILSLNQTFNDSILQLIMIGASKLL